MLKPSKLRVKPVRRYRRPRYPSHLDPDPTLFPQPVPFPAGRKLLAAIAAVGLAANSSCGGGGDTPAGQPPAGQDTYVSHPADEASAQAGDSQTTLEGNPLAVALGGLPHRTSAYGTGIPNYIDAELARRAIERTFRQAGYRLALKKQYERDGVAFIIDGYDEEKRVGFVVAAHDNLDDDAYLRWWAPLREDGAATAEEQIAMLRQSVWADKELKPLLADIDSADRLPDKIRRDAAYRAILDKRRRALLSLDEIKRLQSRAIRDGEFIAVVSAYDVRFAEHFDSRYFHRFVEMDSADVEGDSPLGWKLELREISEPTTPQTQIERLERAVREYIDWARRQGAP